MRNRIIAGLALAAFHVLCALHNNTATAAPLGSKVALAPQAPFAVPASGIDSPFEEGLLPQFSPSRTDRLSLEQAVNAYRAQSQADDFTVFDQHLKRFPESAYRISLLTNLGLQYYHYGFFSKAFSSWQTVWDARASAVNTPVKPLVDRAVGELIRMHARIGHADQVEAILTEVNGWPVAGQATEAIAGAREGLWKMRNEWGEAYLCGPMALRSVLALVEPGNRQKKETVERFRSGPHGVSIDEVAALAQKVGLNWQPVKRSSGAPIPVPSIVHWKVSHYAAIVGFEGGRYHLKDPTFGQDLWVTPAALESESSGFFMIPQDKITAGWRLASAEETSQVRGMGFTHSSDPAGTSPDDTLGKPPSCNGGCAGYNVHSMLVSLNIKDTPVFYRSSKGPSVGFTVTYSQREAGQPATPNYSHLGAKWTHNWLSYVQDDPGAPTANVTRFEAGGGSRLESGFNTSTNSFAPEKFRGAVLARVSSSPVVYEFTQPDGSKLIYGYSDGATSVPRRVFLTRKVDPQGNAVTLAYDAQRRLATITDAAGKVSTLTYGSSISNLLITKFTNPAGQFASVAYDASGRLISITDAVGIVSQFTYAAAPTTDFVKTLTTPYGATNFEFGEVDTQRWLIATDPKGEKERFEFRHKAPGIPGDESNVGIGNGYLFYRNSFYWDKQAYKLYGPSSAGGDPDYTKARINHFLHTADGQATARTLESVKDPLSNRIWFEYPNNPYYGLFEGSTDQPISISKALPDGSTQTQKIEYNVQGNVTRKIDPVGRDTYYDYASNGIDVIAIRQKVSGSAYATTAQYTYNSLHQPLTYTDAAGKVTTYTYNGSGQVVSIKDALNRTTTFAYNANGYLGSVTNANGVIQASYIYDLAGNLTTSTDSEGRAETYTYDGLNRRTKATYPDATTEKWVYDKLDMVSYTDRLGKTTTYAYDAVRNLINKTEPTVGSVLPTRVTRYGYYPNGLLQTLTDPNGKLTTWNRDVQGRVTTKVYADGATDTYVYDLAGRLLTKTDPLSQVTTNGYTGDDRLNSLTFSNAVYPTPNVSYTWDVYFPRMSSMTDGAGTTTFSYIAPGQNGALNLLCDSGPWATSSICYTYDALGRLATRAVQSADGVDASSYTYDALGRLSAETLGKLGPVSHTYLGQTNQEATRNSTFVAATFGYLNNAGDRRLQSIQYTAPIGGLSNKYFYSSNALPQITQIATGFDAVNGIKTTQQFTYDYFNRLTAVSSSQSTATVSGLNPTNTQFAFDPADNMTRADFGVWQFNDLNQLVDAAGTPYVYDANGNLLSNGNYQYQWDARNRLISATDSAGAVTKWSYDGLDRRSVLTEGSKVSRYRWCGEELCAVLDGASHVRAYLYGDRGEYNAGTVLAYSVDHLGSVRHVNNGTTGAWMLSLDYDAYGYPSASLCASAGCALTSDDRLSRYFAGLFVNGRTSLYLANYRAYSMETGRWLNRDPIEESGGLNLYAYADNQPIKYTDQSGLLPQCRLVAFEWICIEPPLVPIDPTDPVESRSRERKRAGTTAANVLEGIRNKVCPKLPQNRCEAREAEDNQICSGLTWIDGARRRCYASAAKRLAACEAGLPVEPLSW